MRKIHHEDLIARYGGNEKFKKGNVGIICQLEHLETRKSFLVVNTHLYWNPKFDFVKYGQAFWLLMKISEFLKDFDLINCCNNFLN